MRTKKVESKDSRQQKLITLLKETDGYLTRDTLCAELNISKATLTTDLQELNQKGFRFDSPNRSGKVRLLSGGPSFDSFSSADIRRWTLLEFLRESALPVSAGKLYIRLLERIFGPNTLESADSYTDLKSALQHIASDTPEAVSRFACELKLALPVSIHTVQKDLTWMKNAGWITDQEMILEDGSTCQAYRCTEKAPLVIRKTFGDLTKFSDDYSSYTSTGPFRDALQGLNEKCVLFTDGIDDITELPVYQTRGVQGSFSEQTVNNLRKLLSLDFRKYAVEITWLSRSRKQTSCRLLVGLVVYTTEKNQIYLLGKDLRKKRRCIPVETILPEQLRITDVRNDIYNSRAWRDIFDEMFSVSVEAPALVKVRFQCFGTIREKVTALLNSRHTSEARLTLVEDEQGRVKELIYEDKIRGLDDFARYLRSFGMSAIAVEPPELVNRMKRTAALVLEQYEAMENNE